MLIAGIGGGVLLVLLIGGGLTIFFIIRAMSSTAEKIVQAATNPPAVAAPATPSKPVDDSKPPSKPDKPADSNKPDPGVADPKPPDNPKPPDTPKPPDNTKPPDNPKPPDTPKPPDPPAGPVVVQQVAQSIPLDGKPVEVMNILFAQPSSNQAVVLTNVPTAQFGKTIIRLDRYDLATGNKIDSVPQVGDGFQSFQDLTPDGNTYLCNSGNRTFTVWRLPNSKPVLDKWTIPSSNIGSGNQTTIIAAYLLDDRRFVTINGGAQVFFWSIADKKEAARYIPPADVAKYPQGLANGGTTAISPDRKKLAVFNGFDGFFIMDLTTMRLAGQIHSPEDAKQPAADMSLAPIGSAFSPDGSQFAAMFQWAKLIGKALPANLVRWNLQSGQIASRFENPTKLGAGMLTRIAWWGPDYFWISLLDNTGRSDLVSWDRAAEVMRTASKNGDRAYPTGGDGRYWFLVAGADGKAVLKGVDRPADALQQAGPDPGKLLTLTPDGVVKK